jgi:hypothetical protein
MTAMGKHALSGYPAALDPNAVDENDEGRRVNFCG